MKGFILTPEQLSAIESALSAALVERGKPQFLRIGRVALVSGEHVGKVFVPFEDRDLTNKITPGTVLSDYPESAAILNGLGGLDARVEIDNLDITADIDA